MISGTKSIFMNTRYSTCVNSCTHYSTSAG